MRRKFITTPATAPFLGIATGKRVKAKAEAARLLEEEKRKTLLLQQQQATAGYNPEAEKAAAAIKLEETKAAATIAQSSTEAKTSNTLYYIIGGIVFAVMIGLYFITKKR